MHIHQVIVCGFRSYKDEVYCSPFSDQLNVVVGRNGTGKSNFFDAIQFGLLTSRFANLRQEERQALLHEGSGKHVMSAFVEIIFNNDDGRLPVDTPKVALRRTIGVKKDEFFLNRKHITKADVIHLLESAGFSRANPYYIVQQGKVNALALMKAKDRLELLKEVAGTRVYEDRRVESLKIMSETQSRREKIQEVISYIEERLAELDEEKEELKRYETLDRAKRALEYTMLDQTLTQVKKDLDLCDQQRSAEALRSNELHSEMTENTITIQQHQTQIQQQQQQLEEAEVAYENLLGEQKDSLSSSSDLKSELSDISRTISLDEEKLAEAAVEVESLKQEIGSVEEEIREKLQPLYAKQEENLLKVEEEMNETKAMQVRLISKQSRKNQFTTQLQRDNFLQQEIDTVGQTLNAQKQEVNKLESQLSDVEKELVEDLGVGVSSNSDTLEKVNEDLENICEEIFSWKKKRNVAGESRKQMWRELDRLQTTDRNLANQLRECRGSLEMTMPADVRRGLQALYRDKRNEIYGTIGELLQPRDDRFATVLDEAAGNSLFHVVVETDQIAANLMTYLNNNRLGRVTFLPLNVLKVTPPNIPLSGDDGEDQVLLLKDQFVYDRKFESAVSCVIGKKLICRDLSSCIRVSRRRQVDCLTLDGDVVHRRGALHGGYRDPKKNRTLKQMQINEIQQQIDQTQQQMQQMNRQIQQQDQEVTHILGEIDKLELAGKRKRDEVEEKRGDRARQKRLAERLAQRKKQLQNSIAKAKNNVKTTTNSIHQLEEELATPMQQCLTEEEAQNLRDCSKKLKSLTVRQQQSQQQKDQISTEIQQRQTLLSSNLGRRCNELEELLEKNSRFRMALAEKRNRKAELELNHADRLKSAEEVEDSLNAMAKEVKNQKQKQKEITDMLDDLMTRQSQCQQEIEQEALKQEKILTKRNRFLQKREETMKEIRELGTLPLNELEKYSGISLRKAMKTLKHTRSELTKYDHVNKKALDQYLNFSDQREQLLQRQKECEEGSQSIQELIEVLDQRKDEAILRTFKGVSHHFTQVFEELVPTGQGKMVILRSEDSDSTNNDDEVDTFIGIQVKVNFRGEGDSYLMSQLSGGQKALVALAFIFAVQRCDPAPFYLFDEIDQALDSTHRAAVADLIHRQAHSTNEPAQFITSTFRPELVNVADQCYGIAHQHKISNVHTMTKKESLQFIANIMAEEEGTVNK